MWLQDPNKDLFIASWDAAAAHCLYDWGANHVHRPWTVNALSPPSDLPPDFCVFTWWLCAVPATSLLLSAWILREGKQWQSHSSLFLSSLLTSICRNAGFLLGHFARAQRTCRPLISQDEKRLYSVTTVDSRCEVLFAANGQKKGGGGVGYFICHFVRHVVSGTQAEWASLLNATSASLLFNFFFTLITALGMDTAVISLYWWKKLTHGLAASLLPSQPSFSVHFLSLEIVFKCSGGVIMIILI